MQRDLFKDISGEEKTTHQPVSSDETQPSFFERACIVLTLDKIILWVLLNITVLIFIYSFGIEQGINLARRSPSAVLAKQNQTSARVLTAADASVNSSSQVATDFHGRLPVAFVERSAIPVVAAMSDAAGGANILAPGQGTAQEMPSVDTAELAQENFFTIQLITYARRDQANQEIERLRQKGYRAFVIPSGKFHQVCIEVFPDKAQALQKLVSLRTEGYDRIYRGAYVRPIRK